MELEHCGYMNDDFIKNQMTFVFAMDGINQYVYGTAFIGLADHIIFLN